MHMYIIFIILLLNYEKTIRAHNIGSSGRDCVLIILFQIYGCKAEPIEDSLFWVGQYDLPHLQPSYWEKN